MKRCELGKGRAITDEFPFRDHRTQIEIIWAERAEKAKARRMGQEVAKFSENSFA